MIHDADALEDSRASLSFGSDDIFVLNQNAATHRLVETDHVFHQGALPGSRPAQNDEHFTAIDLKGNVVDHHGALVRGGNAPHLNDGLVSCPRVIHQRYSPRA